MKTHTLEKEQAIHVDIHSLKLVKENLEKEVQNLHYSRANLSQQVGDVRKELRNLETQKLMEATRLDNAQRKADEETSNRLNAKAKNLQVLQAQIADREATVTRREEKLIDLDKRIDEIRIESLNVERMKKAVREKELALDAKKFEVDASIAIATSRQQDANEKLKKAEEFHRQALEMGYRNSDTNKRLAEREAVLKRAEEAMSRHLDLIQNMEAREKALTEREQSAGEPQAASVTQPPSAEPVAPSAEPAAKRKPGRPPKVQG